MHLKHISILNFKNIGEFEADFSPRFNCFLGDNGVGKTNLMDAIYYLSFTKSHFNAIDRQTIRHGEEMFVLQGRYDIKGEKVNVVCGLKRHSKKQVKRDGKQYDKFSEHIGLLPLVFITPSDTEIIHLGSELRRKYLDGVISQYDKYYLQQLIQYKRALEQRNALLKKLSPENPYDEDALMIWDERLVSAGTYIHQKRREAVEALVPIFNRYYEIISSDAEQVSINYKSGLFEKPLEQLLKDNRQRDLYLRHTTAGTHRDDLDFELNGYPLKKTGSQGQEKTLIIALKLAQFDFIHQTVDVRPLLLLDDVFDKLDAQRINQLVNLLSDDNYGQVFFSDTSRERLPGLLKHIDVDVRIFNVENQNPKTNDDQNINDNSAGADSPAESEGTE
ncbi:MAG TPA: DNA replication/repair protein RecF [Bacteroidales bacterium]|nr:DNA replication/repair protein RecF [Bacteroidales bacterium]